MGAIVGQRVFECLDDGTGSAACAPHPHDRMPAKAAGSHESVEISVECNYDSTLHGQGQDVLVRPLHSELRYVPALIAQVAGLRPLQ